MQLTSFTNNQCEYKRLSSYACVSMKQVYSNKYVWVGFTREKHITIQAAVQDISP